METIAVVDPLTGQKLHDIQAHSATDVALKFQVGREAQPSWNDLGAAGRSKIAHKLVDVLISNQEQIMDLLQKEKILGYQSVASLTLACWWMTLSLVAFKNPTVCLLAVPSIV